MSATQPAVTQAPPAKVELTNEQLVAYMRGLKAELEEIKKGHSAAVTTNIGDAYVLQMNIRGYDETGREVMWNVRGKTVEEFDKVLASHAERINKLQSIRTKVEAPAPVANGEEVPTCAIHSKPMSKRQRKDGSGTFWSCGEKLPDGSWCPYKPKGK